MEPITKGAHIFDLGVLRSQDAHLRQRAPEQFDHPAIEQDLSDDMAGFLRSLARRG